MCPNRYVLRPRRIDVRLTEEQYRFIEEWRRRMGLATDSDAVRSMIGFLRWMTESKFLAIPSPEVLMRIYGAINEYYEERERKGR